MKEEVVEHALHVGACGGVGDEEGATLDLIADEVGREGVEADAREGGAEQRTSPRHRVHPPHHGVVDLRLAAY